MARIRTIKPDFWEDEIAADVRLRESRSEEPHLEHELSLGEILRLAAET